MAGRFSGSGVFAAVAAAAVLCAAGPAPASPAPVRLIYQQAAGAELCPARGELVAEVEAILSRSPFEDGAARVVEVLLWGDEDGLHAHVALRDGLDALGVRDLDSPSADCRELGRAVALAIAIAVDPIALLSAPLVHTTASTGAPLIDGALAAELDAAAVPLAAPRPISVAARRAPARPPIDYAARVGAIAAVGTTPGVSPGLVVGGRARRGDASFAMEIRFDRGGAVALGEGAVTAGLLAGAAVPCLHRDALAVCAVGAVGLLRGEGHRLPNARADATPYFAYGARLALERPLFGGVSASAHLDLLGTAGRTTIRVGEQAVWSTPAMSATAGVAALARFR